MFEKSEKGIAAGLVFLLIVSLLPVIYLGRYNHPTGDDYYYGVDTKTVWEQTGSLAMTFVEAARGVSRQYEIWQGTYSAMFLMYLPPNIFGDWAYRLVTGMLLLLLTGSIFYLTKPVVCTMLKGSVSLWCILSSLLALLCVQTVPSQGETFFWYNGSMYYTGFYAVALFFVGVLFRYLTVSRYWHVPVMILLAGFLAGGNYVSLLPTLLFLVSMTILLLYKKSIHAVGLCIATFVMGAGLLVSAKAPGNSIRQDGMWKIPAWKAILKSLFQGLRYTTVWTGVWLIMALIIMTPFLWRIFSNMKFRFQYPFMVMAFIYGIFCSMSCPTFYTMNSTGPARAVAIVYYGYLLSTFMCYGYFLGWLNRVVKERQLGNRMIAYIPALRVSAIVVCILLFCLQIVDGEIAKATTGKAVRLLASGEAAGYEQEYQERLVILADDSIEDVVFQPYVHQPDMLYVGDFTEDAQNENNIKIAHYFKKNTLRVEY